MRSPRTLASKLVLVGSLLLALALTSIGLTLRVSWQLEGGAAAVNEAGRLRMQTWRLVAQADGGDGTARDELVQRFDAGLALLRSGAPSRPLFVPWNDASRARFDAIERDWAGLRQAWRADPPPPAAAMIAQGEAFVGRIDGFVDAIEQELARWTAILNMFQLAMLGLAIACAVAALYAAYLFVLNPLDRLRSGLARVQAGDLGTRVEVQSADEFGLLATGFNRMAETLQGLYGTLEAKVREKTARLATERERLAALYEASEFLARSDSLDSMARGFVRQLRRIANADAAAIRWSDEANRHYHLLAGDCLPQSLAEDEHCLATGDCLCGRPRADGGTRVIPIRSPQQPGAGMHCTRAGFETLVSVPVLLQQRLLGEIDLFYRGPVTLDAEARGLLDALASHLASAMEGLRAGALERESAVAEERGLLARELHDSIAQSLVFLRIQVRLLRDALRRGDDAAVARTLDELDAGVGESTADVRELLLHFRTRTSEEDIVPALRGTLQKFQHQTGLATHLDVTGEGLPADPDVQVQVLHVLQEALSNVRKHAAAQAVWLSVRRGREWRFELRDDGRGFDTDAAAPDETHVGLRIMRERAERIGARVTVAAAPEGGTRVTLRLPALNAAAAATAAPQREATA